MQDDQIIRTDNSEFKRVELHAHSKMSECDAFSDPEEIIKLAASFGHKACAITDHASVQGFPRFYEAAININRNRREEDKIKPVFGCEGYLVDDGPTIFYNLPYTPAGANRSNEPVASMVVGEFVSLAITANGDDPCTDTFSCIAACKYRLKGYKAARTQTEGETREQAEAIIAQDIDRKLWDASEMPASLQDANLPHADVLDGKSTGHILNIEGDPDTPVSDDISMNIPQKIEYEHIADFYADVEDIVYPGRGEPCGSYFLMGELLSFIGNAYITGEDIFKTLGFIRRAGFGVDIEEHKYYRHKFLMPAISIEDIKRYAVPAPTISRNGMPAENELISKARRDAAFVISYLADQNCVDPQVLNSRIGHIDINYPRYAKHKMYHITWLARNSLGMYNLYNLVSEANIHYFFRRPRTPKSLLRYFSSSLLIGGACERGEIYRLIMTAYKSCGKDTAKTIEYLKNNQVFIETLKLYDYVEIQPLCNNNFLAKQDLKYSDTGKVAIDETDIKNVNILIADLCDIFDKTLVATTDSHYLDPEDSVYRKYMLMSLGFLELELSERLYFRTTEEMLSEFSYLGEERAFRAVVTNTNAIADKIDKGIKPFPSGAFHPDFPYAAQAIRDISYTKAGKLYRNKGELDKTVKERLDNELTSIINNGYASLYYIPYRLVKYSKSRGSNMGSRGASGSSFVAYLLGITGINPLMPHYRCPKCCYTEFDTSGSYGSGFDLPEKNCPECGAEMNRDGHNIPFESFAYFHGDMQPYFYINTTAENKESIHKYAEYLFGSHHVLKAGITKTFGEKKAVQLVKDVCEYNDIPYTAGSLEKISKGMIGVRYTTSQHPGKLIIVPKEMDINEFTPVQYAANNHDGEIITTHFDVRSMHDALLEQDFPAYSVLNMLCRLSNLTGVNIENIPLTDPMVMNIFDPDKYGLTTFGLPEFHYPFMINMIKESKPKTFFDIVQLLGLAHGTNTWNGNAEELIRSGTCSLCDVLAFRETIMTKLINYGLESRDAYDIMTMVRKGKISRANKLNTSSDLRKWNEYKEMMKEHNVPDWFIESCQKIHYMFPIAHAVAYTISALRIAWFKVYYPLDFYCAVFSERNKYFNAQYMCKGIEKLVFRKYLLFDVINGDIGDNETDEESRFALKEEFRLYEIIEEMYKRGIRFAPIDINTSHATEFIRIGDNLILPPLNAISGITDHMAQIITGSREERPFRSREDLRNRMQIGFATINTLDNYGLLDNMPISAQMDIFDLIDP